MEFYPTQYELLQSRGLAERVVKSLDLMEDPAFNPGAGAGRDGRARPHRRGRRRRARPPRRPDPWRPLGRAGAQHPARPALLPRRRPRVRRPGRQRLRRGVHRHGGRGPLRHRRQGLHLPVLADREAEAGDPGQGDPAPGLQPPQRHRHPGPRSERHPEAAGGAQRPVHRGQEAAHRAARPSTTRPSTAPAESMADSLSAGVVSEQRGQILELEREYETKLKTYKPDFPDMVALKAEIEKARQHLNERRRGAGGQGAEQRPRRLPDGAAPGAGARERAQRAQARGHRPELGRRSSTPT